MKTLMLYLVESLNVNFMLCAIGSEEKKCFCEGSPSSSTGLSCSL